VSDRRTVATFLLGAAGLGAAVWFRDGLNHAWAPVLQAIAPIWMHLLAQSRWPNWAVYLVTVPSVISVAYLGWRYLHRRKYPHWRFKELRFLGTLWRWNNLSDLPHTLEPYCPTCQGLLVYEELGGRSGSQPQSVALYCENCQMILTEQPGTWKYLQARIAREIERLSRTGEWRQHVPHHQSFWRIRRNACATDASATAALDAPQGGAHGQPNPSR
jgi:hypothetical protein